jgi:hypothetical protein
LHPRINSQKRLTFIGGWSVLQMEKQATSNQSATNKFTVTAVTA